MLNISAFLQFDPAMTSYKKVKLKRAFTAPLLDGKTKECSVTCRAQVEDGLSYSGGGTSRLIQRTASTRTGQTTGQASESQQVLKRKNAKKPNVISSRLLS